MTAINTNNQIVKFDYPIKDLRENVEVKQKELSHELDSTPLKRENYCRENEIVLKEPLKLDKESIVSLQEEKSSLKPLEWIRYLKNTRYYYENATNEKNQNHDDLFQNWVEYTKKFLVWDQFTCKVDIIDRKATFYVLNKLCNEYGVFEDYGDFIPFKTIEVWEDEKTIFLKTENYHSIYDLYHFPSDLHDNIISSNSNENKIEENTFSSSSSYFLDEYLKQKDISNQFLIHQLIDNKLLKNLNLIV